MTADAAITVAKPMRLGQLKFVEHADHTFEISSRLTYTDAVRYAKDRGAEIIADEKRARDELDAELDAVTARCPLRDGGDE